MTETGDHLTGQAGPRLGAPAASKKIKESSARRLRAALFCLALAITFSLASALWLGAKASHMKSELEAAYGQISELKDLMVLGRADEAKSHFETVRAHTLAARGVSEDPLWALASALPWLGVNFSAASEIARSADDIAASGVGPLLNTAGSLDWKALLPGSSGSDLELIRKASPSIGAAAHAVRISQERLESIDTHNLLPQVADPLVQVRMQLRGVTAALDAAADVSKIAPAMLGAEGKRQYLLIIQNSAESRTTGGIPGALAVLTLDSGKMSLSDQSSTSDIGIVSPAIAVDPEQEIIYSERLGKFIQDVNLTPDYPTSAKAAQAMWRATTGKDVDGVISLDPVALSYLLEATGPVKTTQPHLAALSNGRLPTTLTTSNVVKTLLSDVYAEIEDPAFQDAYFAGVAHEVFAALSTPTIDPKALIEAISRGAAEGRVLVWSATEGEQDIVAKYAASGSIAGPSVSPAQFGVYFNDGTGAKMDYHVRRTVQLVQECTGDDYGQVKVRIISTNTAPADAATSLPVYVTGGGAFGVAPGTVQTNVIAYGPVQANVETANVDGRKVSFAANRHANRPVGTVTVTLAPGQSSTVEMTFGKIVQHTEPNLVVTPTVQALKDVVLAAEVAKCVSGK